MALKHGAWTLLIAGAVAQAADSVPPEAFDAPDRRQQIERVLPLIEASMARMQKDLKLPGVAYALVVDKHVLLAGGAGQRDREAQAPATADSAFRIASMTKSFTALAILKLRDAGRLRLDDAVDQHVPELRGWRPATADAGPITLRQLLAHTAGLPEDNPHGDRQLALSPQAFSDWVRGAIPLARAPGSAFEYSNLGYMLLGRVVGNVSGRPYQAYIRDEILRPLGMQNSYWSVAAVPSGRLALGYAAQGTGFEPVPMLEDGEGGAMGGLITSARDLGLFVAAMLQAWPPRDEPETPPALRRTLREMQTGQGWPQLWVARRWPGSTAVSIATSYGFGLTAWHDCRWGRMIEHSGGLPGFGSQMLWLPDHGVGVVVMSNLTYGAAGRMAGEALRLLHEGGALPARVPVAAPALVQAAAAVEQLVLDWSDARAEAVAADNLFLDEPLAERRAAIVKQREGLGQCRRATLKPENALRGQLRLDCERGWLDVELTLAPVPGVRVQHLAVTGGKPPQPALAQAIDASLMAMAKGVQALNLAPGADRSTIAAVLESARISHGSCRLDEVLGGDGTTQARVRLRCDRGAPELDITVDQDQLTRLSVRPQPGAICAP